MSRLLLLASGGQWVYILASGQFQNPEAHTGG